MRLREILERARRELDARDRIREEFERYFREISRACMESVRSAHRGEYDRAKSKLEDAMMKLEELRKILEGYPELRYGNQILQLEQEISEASLVLSIFSGSDIESYDSLGVSPIAYLLGAADAIGEMRRRVLDLLRKGDLESAERIFELMEEIFEDLTTFDYPNSILPGFRRKLDIARGVIEKTRGDLTIALRENSLERRIEELEKMLGSEGLER